MKTLLTTLLFGKDNKVGGLIALSIIAAVALGCTCGKGLDLGNIGKESNSEWTSSNSTNDTTTDDSDGGIPSESTLQSMVKETTSDFAQAIDSGDFSEIYEKSSSDFQNSYTEAQMKDVFKAFVQKKAQVLPSLNKVSSTDAVFSPPPAIRTEKGLSILVLNGSFPTKPLPVKFEYEYVLRGGEWKMLKLVVKM